MWHKRWHNHEKEWFTKAWLLNTKFFFSNNIFLCVYICLKTLLMYNIWNCVSESKAEKSNILMNARISYSIAFTWRRLLSFASLQFMTAAMFFGLLQFFGTVKDIWVQKLLILMKLNWIQYKIISIRYPIRN